MVCIWSEVHQIPGGVGGSDIRLRLTSEVWYCTPLSLRCYTPVSAAFLATSVFLRICMMHFDAQNYPKVINKVHLHMLLSKTVFAQAARYSQ